MYIQEGLKNACNQLSARISESDLVHIFTNSFTGQSHTLLFAVAYGCFHATKAALSSCDRDYLLKQGAGHLCETPVCTGGETKARHEQVSYPNPFSLRNSLSPSPLLCK